LCDNPSFAVLVAKYRGNHKYRGNLSLKGMTVSMLDYKRRLREYGNREAV
jgi:hypothetical protein